MGGQSLGKGGEGMGRGFGDSREKRKYPANRCFRCVTRDFGAAHLVAAGALGLGHAATKAIHLGREHVTASRGALPVAGTNVAAAASVPATAPAPTAAVRVSSATTAPAQSLKHN